MKTFHPFLAMRTTLSKRPLCFACGLFLIVLFGAVYTEWLYALTVGTVTLALAIVCIAVRLLRPQKCRFGLSFAIGTLIAVSAALLIAHFAVRVGYHEKIDPPAGQSGQAEIVVTKPLTTTVYSASCEGKLLSMNGKSVELEGIFYFPYEVSLQTGDRLSAELTLSPIRTQDADLSDLYSLSQGLFFTAEISEDSSAETLVRKDNQTVFPQSLTNTLQDALSSRLRLYLPDDACGLAMALLLGERSELPSALSRNFRHLGISHTLAVSGLHLGILLGSLTWLLKKLRLPRKAHLIVLLPITLLYIMLVGSPSVMRAGGMLLLLLGAHPFGRKRDPLTSLFLSVSLICLISPFSVLDIGLQLSFLSTLGILLVGLPLTERCRKFPSLLRWLTGSLILTASALTFTLPHSIFYFGEISLISPLANLLFVPLINLMLYLIPLLLLLSPIPLLAATPAYALRLLCALTTRTAELIGAKDTFMLSLELSLAHTVGAIVIGVGIALLLFRKTRPLVLVCTVVFLTFSSLHLYQHTRSVQTSHECFAYSDGENDALLVRDGTRVMLCDASNGGYTFLANAIDYAEHDPAVRVDSLLLTHYHSRMLSTLTRLLENSSVEFLILPIPDEAHSDLAATLEVRATRAGCKVRYYSADECLISYHGYSLLIDSDGEGNHPLNALTVSYEEAALLCYLADASQAEPISAALLPACHNAESRPDGSLWNRRYD